MSKFTQYFQRFAGDESGVTAIEYAMIASAVSLAILTAVNLMAEQMDTTYATILGFFDTVL